LPTFVIHLGQDTLHVSLRASMHSQRAPEDEARLPSDMLISIGRGPEDPDPFKAEVVACASFVRLAPSQNGDSVRLILRPRRAGSEEIEPLEALEIAPIKSGILPWPTWGPDRIECASKLIRALVDGATSSR
jgi:hypothetical protein